MKNTGTRRPRLEKNARNISDFINVLPPTGKSPPPPSSLKSHRADSKKKKDHGNQAKTVGDQENEKRNLRHTSCRANIRKLSRSHKVVERQKGDQAHTPPSSTPIPSKRSAFQQRTTRTTQMKQTEAALQAGMFRATAPLAARWGGEFEQPTRTRISRKNVLPVIHEKCDADEDLSSKMSLKVAPPFVKKSKGKTMGDEELGLFGPAPEDAPIQTSTTELTAVDFRTVPKKPGAVAVRGPEYDPTMDDTHSYDGNSITVSPIEQHTGSAPTTRDDDDEAHATFASSLSSSRPRLISAFLVKPEKEKNHQQQEGLPAAVVLRPPIFTRKCILIAFSIVTMGLIAAIAAIMLLLPTSGDSTDPPTNMESIDPSTKLSATFNPSTEVPTIEIPTTNPSTELPTTETPSTIPPTYGQWNQLGQVLKGDEDGKDLFGAAIALSRTTGDTLAIGAPGKELGGVEGSGYVTVFKLHDDTHWKQLGQVLKADNENQVEGESHGDWFGRSLSLSSDGSRLAVGSPGSNAGERDGGQVQVFQLNQNSNTWHLLGNAMNHGESYSYFGSSLSLSSTGDRVAAGAPSDDSGGYDAVVKVFQRDAQLGSGWNPIGGTIGGKERWDGFGRTLSLSDDGTRLAVGGRHGFLVDTGGQVRVYQYIGGEWELVGLPVTAGNDYSFGYNSMSLSGSGTILAVGACDSDNPDNPSRVQVFEIVDNDWTKLGESLGGCIVSLSSGGKRLAIGAEDDDQVQVYQFQDGSGEWIPVGESLQGKAESLFGRSISLTSDGNRVAVGAREDFRGCVQVFQLQ